MGDEIYCVYVKLGPDGTPAYVGAGTKNRPGYHDRRNVRHRNKRLAAIYKEAGVKNLPTQIILENLTQERGRTGREAVDCEDRSNQPGHRAVVQQERRRRSDVSGALRQDWSGNPGKM